MNPAITTTAFALLLGATAPAQERPPRGRELQQLVERCLTLDDRTAAGHAEREAILARVATVPPLRPRDLDKWRKKIIKLWDKGPKLQKSGDNLFFADDRGRYVVAGETRKPRGLCIAMHGGGRGSGDAGPTAASYGRAGAEHDLLVIAPEVLQRTERGWTDSGSEEFVLDLVDAALRTWEIDADKVFFVGHSMGGYGSWLLGAHHADRVAAIAPSAGAPTPIRERPGGPIVDLIEGVIPSLRSVYVSIYQSTDDPRVPPAPNQFAAKALDSARQRWGGFGHDYWEVDDRGHGAPPGGHAAHLARIAERSREATPQRIVWQPVLDWKRQFYWLYWQQPVANAIVQADRDGNAVTITCESPCEGLWVLVDERTFDLDEEITVTVNGTETFRGKLTAGLETLLRTSTHPDPKLQYTARAPAFEQKDG